MKAKQKEEFEIDKEGLKLLMKLKLKQEPAEDEETVDFEDAMQESDIYNEDEIEVMLDDESISGEELAFMVGYLAS